MSADSDYALKLFESLKMKYGPLRKQFEADENLIQQRMSIDIKVDDQPIELITPPTAYDAVQNAADHLLTTPRISVPPRPTSGSLDTATKTAEKLQQFYNMFWDNVFARCGDPLGNGKGELVLGRMVLKVMPRFDIIPPIDDYSTTGKNKYRSMLRKAGRSTFMWNVELVPKESVLEDRTRPYDPDYAFEYFNITATEAKRRFETVPERIKKLEPLEEVEYVEYWEKPSGSSKGRYIQWIDGNVVNEDDNPLCTTGPTHTAEHPSYIGRIPYVTMASGWGDGRPNAKPENQYVSIIKYARSVIEAECRFMTMIHEAMKYAAFKPTKTMNLPPDKELAITPGAVWSMQEGQDAGFIDPGEIPASLFQGVARVNQYVDQTTKFSTLGGMPQRGVDTATEADQNIRNAATKLSGPIRSMRAGIMKVNEYVAWDIENVYEAPITLYGASPNGPSEVTITPSDINGFYMTHVELETSDEAALNLRNARTWSDLTQRIPISFKTAMRMAGIMNASQEIDERMIENLEQSQPAMGALLQIMMQGLGSPSQTPGAPEPSVQPAMEDTQGPSQAQAEAVQNAPERQFR